MLSGFSHPNIVQYYGSDLVIYVTIHFQHPKVLVQKSKTNSLIKT
jgi:hypothetical protein